MEFFLVFLLIGFVARNQSPHVENNREQTSLLSSLVSL